MFWHRLTDLETAAPEKEPLECGRTKRVLRPVRKNSQGSCDSTVKRWRYDVDIVGSLLAIDLWKTKSAIPIFENQNCAFQLDK